MCILKLFHYIGKVTLITRLEIASSPNGKENPNHFQGKRYKLPPAAAHQGIYSIWEDVWGMGTGGRRWAGGVRWPGQILVTPHADKGPNPPHALTQAPTDGHPFASPPLVHHDHSAPIRAAPSSSELLRSPADGWKPPAAADSSKRIDWDRSTDIVMQWRIWAWFVNVNVTAWCTWYTAGAGQGVIIAESGSGQSPLSKHEYLWPIHHESDVSRHNP